MHTHTLQCTYWSSQLSEEILKAGVNLALMQLNLKTQIMFISYEHVVHPEDPSDAIFPHLWRNGGPNFVIQHPTHKK